MENATKALVMAGGVLISVMIIATLLYALSIWKIIPNAQDQVALNKEISAFNQQYESYDRDALYGSDIFSVLNKAIENNNKYGVTSKEESRYINIEFTILTDVNDTVTISRRYISSKKTVEMSSTEEPKLSKRNKPYSLSNDLDEIKNFVKNGEITIVEGNVEYDRTQKEYYQPYTETIPAAEEFKSRIFSCTNVDYDSEGRINFMKFEEKKVKN